MTNLRITFLCTSIALSLVLLAAACSGPTNGDGDGEQNGNPDASQSDTADNTDAGPNGGTDVDGGTMQSENHACPTGKSCLVYAQNGVTSTGNSVEPVGSAWFVDPAKPSERVNLSKMAGAKGPVGHMAVDKTGRYVVYEQEVEIGSKTSDAGFLVDLAGENAPTVEKIADNPSSHYRFSPDSNYMWAMFNNGPTYAAVETPTRWAKLHEVDDTLEPFGTPRGTSMDSEWGYILVDYLPEQEPNKISQGVYRTKLGESPPGLESIFDPRKMNHSDVFHSRYVPEIDLLFVSAGSDSSASDLFAMAPEPGAKRTKVLDIERAKMMKQDLDATTLSPDGKKLVFVVKKGEFKGPSEEANLTLRFVNPDKPDSVLGKADLGTGAVDGSPYGAVDNQQGINWKPDGSGLVVEAYSSERIWYVDANSYQATELPKEIPESLLRFGPDGKLYFDSDDDYKSGPGLYRTEVPNASNIEKLVDMPKTELNHYFFSADGSQIFFTADTDYDEGYDLYAAPLSNPADATILNEKIDKKHERVGHVFVVGARSGGPGSL